MEFNQKWQQDGVKPVLVHQKRNHGEGDEQDAENEVSILSDRKQRLVVLIVRFKLAGFSI